MSNYKFNDNQIAIIEKLGLNLSIDDVEKLFFQIITVGKSWKYCLKLLMLFTDPVIR